MYMCKEKRDAREKTEEKRRTYVLSARSPNFTLVFLLRSYFASIQINKFFFYVR